MSFVKKGGLWVIAQAVLLLAAAFVPIGVKSVRPFAFWEIGCFLIGMGCLMALLGALALGKNLTPLPQPNSGSSLKTTGIYSLVRHPIYGGLVLVIAGYSAWFFSRFSIAMVVITIVFFTLKSASEERRLIKEFPDYAVYRKTTRRLIPWLF